ncbi:MAG: SH3 domain-containing protein, partial [Ruminococcus sp.]|nr:SH3 domain-containing protein [Ruminococcus sp.]
TSATTTTTTTTTTDPYKQTVEPQMIDDYGTMYVIADELIIRIGPGYDYERLEDTIPNGTALDVSAEQIDAKSGESWCYISYDGNDGWVSKSFLSLNNPTVAVVLPDDYYYDFQRETVKVTRDGGLKLYAGPGTSYDVIDTLEEGATLTKEGYNYFSVKWIYLSIGDQFGWVQSYDGDWFNPTIE